jgi:hypothetical protein
MNRTRSNPIQIVESGSLHEFGKATLHVKALQLLGGSEAASLILHEFNPIEDGTGPFGGDDGILPNPSTNALQPHEYQISGEPEGSTRWIGNLIYSPDAADYLEIISQRGNVLLLNADPAATGFLVDYVIVPRELAQIDAGMADKADLNLEGGAPWRGLYATLTGAGATALLHLGANSHCASRTGRQYFS